MRRRFLLPAAAAALMLAPDGATASTIPVTTLEDVVDSADGRCSLREAILAVNAPPGSGDCVRADANANTIQLGAGTHTLTRAGAHEDAASTGDLDLLAGTVSLTLVGSGAGQTTISAAGLGDRLVDVRPGAPSLAIQNMTLTGGRAPSGTPGNPGAAGGLGEAGGAIRSAGPLALTDVVVTDNRAGNGGAGGDGPDGGGMSGGGPGGPAGAGGTGGAGGAIDITGALTLTRVVLSFNAAGKGGLGGTGGTDSTVAYASGNGGLGGTGGAIAVSGGPLVISGGRFDGNHAGDGGDGGHGENGPSGAHPSAAGAQGGTGGRAGAVFMPGTATVTASTFVANAAGTGGAGGNGGANSDDVAGAGGAGGAGGTTGALLSQFGDATLVNLTLVGNRAGNGGAGGVGGSNLSANGAVGGAGGAGGMAGALRRQGSGTAYLTHGTVTGNAPGFGGAGGQGGAGSANNAAPGASGAAGVTGGVSDGSVTNASFTQITNSIVASNSSANCAGGFADGGRNIAFGDGTCTGFTVADPGLGPLQDNGGPGETRALLAGSPAIDQVPADNAGCPATDARGAARPVAGLCDIGAFEVSPPACQPVAATAVAGVPTPIVLTCTSPAAAPFTFAIAAGPGHGTLSGLDALTGIVTYTADAAYVGADGFGFQGATADGTAASSVAVTVSAAPPGTGSGPGAAPRLSALKLSPKRFRAARSGPSALAARTATGARGTFTLDQAASVRFTAAKRVKGRRSGTRCVKATKRNRKAKACMRSVAVKGSFSRAGSAGANAFRFMGRMRGRKLARGRYLLRATPAAGKTVAVAFQIVR